MVRLIDQTSTITRNRTIRQGNKDKTSCALTRNIEIRFFVQFNSSAAYDNNEMLCSTAFAVLMLLARDFCPSLICHDPARVRTRTVAATLAATVTVTATVTGALRVTQAPSQ